MVQIRELVMVAPPEGALHGYQVLFSNPCKSVVLKA